MLSSGARPRAAFDQDAEEENQQQFAIDVREGLSCACKWLPSKYLYDARGSELFEGICRTPEYYPTRTECALLDRVADRIMRFFDHFGGDLVELGSGSTTKIKKLLAAFPAHAWGHLRYIPVDISPSCLDLACRELACEFEDLNVAATIADFMQPLSLPTDGRRKMILFLGSTIGNLDVSQSLAFLGNLCEVMSTRDRLVIGIDMLKPAALLEAAYNDRQGVTAAFNLNLLTRLNRELGADFDLRDFEHRAFFNPEADRVEMHLRAARALKVTFRHLDWRVSFRPGETIRTEICRKYSKGSAGALFINAGLTPTNWFMDEKHWYSLVVLRKK